MLTILLLLLCLVCGVHAGAAAASSPLEAPADAAVREAVEALQRLYATDILLGKPLEVEGLRLIPLATVSLAYGHGAQPAEVPGMQVAGGIVSPVGVLVVSGGKVQLLQVSKGVFEQVLHALAPVLFRHLAHMPDGAATTARRWESDTIPAVLAALYALLPSQSWRFGIVPWPPALVLVFVVGWLALAILMAALFPRQLRAIATTLQESYLWAGLIGVLGYGVVLILAVAFTLSLIGLPMAFALFLLTWVGTLVGLVSIAWLVGQQLTAAMHRPAAPDVLCVLIGGGILAILRMIPILGWSVWYILSLCGFGALVLLQRRVARRV